MTNEEKIKECIIPSLQFREVVFHRINGDQIKKIQQRHYNYSETASVWRDIPSEDIILFDDFSKKVMFD